MSPRNPTSSSPASPTDDELGEALRLIAPCGVRTGWRRIDPSDLAHLHPAERAAVAHAAPRRRAEFATGRVLLRELSGTTGPILVGPDRAPLLPPGVCASLAHDDELAIAAVAGAGHMTLGLDVEPAVPLDPPIAQLILRPDEQGLDAHLAFTLKEAAYKAWSRLGGGLLEHHDVRLDVAEASFRAEVLSTGARLEGRYARASGRWVALVVTPFAPG